MGLLHNVPSWNSLCRYQTTQCFFIYPAPSFQREELIPRSWVNYLFSKRRAGARPRRRGAGDECTRAIARQGGTPSVSRGAKLTSKPDTQTSQWINHQFTKSRNVLKCDKICCFQKIKHFPLKINENVSRFFFLKHFHWFSMEFFSRSWFFLKLAFDPKYFSFFC